jgi:hypothetical protein
VQICPFIQVRVMRVDVMAFDFGEFEFGFAKFSNPIEGVEL